VGFQLDPAGDPALAKLSGWPAIANWAQVNLRAAIVFADGSQGPETEVPKTDLAVWRAFFPSDTPVMAYPGPPAPPLLNPKNPVWFDAGRVADQVRQRFAQGGRIGFGLAGSSFRQPNEAPGPFSLPEDLKEQLHSFFQASGRSFQAAPIPAPVPDVHDIIAAIHGVPGTLPALRLAFPLSAPWPASIAKPSAISVAVKIDSPATVQTRWFAVKTTAALDGFVSPTSWAVLPFDTTGAAHSLAFSAGNAAFRSAGFVLVTRPLNGASVQLAAIRDRIDRVGRRGDKPTAPYESDDVTRGARVDVFDQTRGRWFSLCRITGKASRNGKAIAFNDAEGMVSGAICRDPDSPFPEQRTVRVNDTIAQWLGWSIIGASPAAQPLPPDPTLSLERTVTPGTLPVLRFGRQYRFRVRKADVNGDGLPLAAVPDFTGASETPVPFLRLEPVAPGSIAFGTPFTIGESPAQLVVRSGPSIQGAQESIRYILPPDIDIDIALMHGVFDGPNGIPDSAASSRFRNRAAWNGTPPQESYPPKAELFAATTFPSKPAVPYLPDPAANAAVLRPQRSAGVIGLGGDDPKLLAPFVQPQAGYPEGWAAAEIHLTPTPGAGAARVDGSAIRISLPPGKMLSFGLTTAVSPALLPQMAAVQWAAQGLPPGDVAIHAEAAENGGIPTLSPPRILTMVHAVQQPLAPAFAGVPAVARAEGATTITLSGSVNVDPETTTSLSILAEWSEWDDEEQRFVARSMRVGEPHNVVNSNKVDFAEVLQIRTTSHVDLTLTPSATSKFAEMFPAGTDCTRSGAVITVPVPASQAPHTPRVAYPIPTFAWSEVRPTPTQVIKKRAGNGLRLWLERPWFTSGAGEKLAVLVARGPVAASDDPGWPVSRWGLDPITHNTLEAPDRRGAKFGIDDFIDTGAPRVPYPGTDHPEWQLVLHEVHFDQESKRYWCDVIFNASQFGGGAYRPFVQLVIAAYQPNAIGAAQQLSEPATVPMIQVFSDREIHVSLGGETQPSIFVQFAGPFLLASDDVTRGLHTQAGLSMNFDGREVLVLDQDPGDGGGGNGGHGHPPPTKPQPKGSPPSFGADSTFFADSGGYSPPLKTGWKTFSVTVWEEEMASFFTEDLTKYRLPNGIITFDKPPAGVPFEFAVFPSSPMARSLRPVYQDTVVITKG
jgi:hypothetical protein